MAYCANCGTTVTRESRWCGACGQRLTTEALGSSTIPDQVTQRPARGRRPAVDASALRLSLARRWSEAVALGRRRPKVTIGAGVAVAVLLVLALAGLLGGGGGGSNGLASSYSCNLAGQAITISFTGTGDAQGNGLAGNVTAGGQVVESFVNGTIRNGQIDFGDVSDPQSDPGDLTAGGQLVTNGLELGQGDAVCSPS